MPVDDDFPVAPGSVKVDPTVPNTRSDTSSGGNVVPIASGGQRRTTRKPTKADMLGEAEGIVTDLQVDAIGMLTPFAPVSAGTWVLYADANTRAILRLAAGHPALLKRILGGGDFMAYVALGTFVVAMGVSVGVELGRVAGDGLVAERFKVAEAFAEVMAEVEGEGGDDGGDEPGGEWHDRRPSGGAPLPGLMGDLSASPGR
jgi:hypothetical protein